MKILFLQFLHKATDIMKELCRLSVVLVDREAGPACFFTWSYRSIQSASSWSRFSPVDFSSSTRWFVVYAVCFIAGIDRIDPIIMRELLSSNSERIMTLRLLGDELPYSVHTDSAARLERSCGA